MEANILNFEVKSYLAWKVLVLTEIGLNDPHIQ